MFIQRRKAVWGIFAARFLQMSHLLRVPTHYVNEPKWRDSKLQVLV
tara:strand:+ start:412 stop:549 length:138 start_codon:yes stop_codon:yes gene_type:complete